METRLIVSRTSQNIKGYTDFTLPMIRKYANGCDADFMELGDEYNHNEIDGDGKFHYKIMECYNLLDNYDRILHLDADIFINKNCPNIFDIVPFDMIGTILEDVGSRQNARRNSIKLIQDKFGLIGWDSGYVNTGVFLTSKCHREIFTKIKGYDNIDEYEEYWKDIGWDDVHLGFQINKMKFKVYELPYIYNTMGMFLEPWNQGFDVFSSYIWHMAGKSQSFPERNKFAKNDKNNYMKYIFEKYKEVWI